MIHSDLPQAIPVTVGSFELAFAPPEVRIDGRLQPLAWRQIEIPGIPAALKAVDRTGHWHWQLEPTRNAAGVAGWRIAMSGTLAHPAAQVTLRPFTLGDFNADRVVAQGISMGGCVNLALPSDREEFEGFYQLILVRDGECLQLTMPPEAAQPARFTARLAGRNIRSLAQEIAVDGFDGTGIAAVPVEIYASRDGFGLMEAYAQDYPGVDREFPAAPAIGWNSWDYYRWTVTEEKVLANALAIARDPVLSRRVKRIIVDDGWEYCYGEWDANSRFPSGMAALARELTQMGFEPGLWFAPAIVEPQAHIAQLDYDMLARGANGWPCLSFECMRRYGFILDPTVDRSRRFLAETFARYAQMGYKFFKLDFLGLALSARRFADASVPRSAIVGRIVDPIRSAVAGRAELLGCNYHFTAGNRAVDAVRVAGDIHARWDSLVRNTVSVAARYWCNRRWWLNDPDFALCRSPETSDDPDLDRLLACLVFVTAEGYNGDEYPDFKLTADMGKEQLEILLSVVLCAAGLVNFSDDMTKLNAAGLALARKVAEAEAGDTARPLDLFEADVPARWLQRTPSGWRLLLVNWHDGNSVPMQFDLAAHGVAAGSARDFWHGSVVPITGGKVEVTLPPRSCRFIEFSTAMKR